MTLSLFEAPKIWQKALSIISPPQEEEEDEEYLDFSEVLLHNPYEEKLFPGELRINTPISSHTQVVITKNGRLIIPDDKFKAVTDARNTIKRLTPDCFAFFCKTLSVEPGDDSVTGGVIIQDASDLPDTIMIALDDRTPTEIRSLAFHECFHKAETLLYSQETVIVNEWADKLEQVPIPDFVVEADILDWWEKPYERLAWSFEHYVYIKEKWKDPEFKQHKGFCIKATEWPRDIVRIFGRVYSGRVGERVIG